jgi:hypothetical protein
VSSSGASATASGTASSSAITGSGGTDAGACRELTLLTLQNPGFESGTLTPGWQGSGNYPQYASVAASAARTGSYGAELNDTGVGVPGIEQKLPVTLDLVGQKVSVTAWVNLLSFPALRLLLEANSAADIHLQLALSDTEPVRGWQELSSEITIPPSTDHLMIKVVSAVSDGEGVAHADDVRICIGDSCTPCAE